MKTLKVYSGSVNQKAIDEAAETLKNGGLVIFPTDTVYSIGCDALNNAAIERLCRVEGINPQRSTLSAACASISMASEYARIDNEAFRILRRNLPGPFTFILPAQKSLPKAFKGRKEVGIRVPDNEIATLLSERLGGPIACASVHPEGGDDAEELFATEIEDRFAREVDLMIDNGDCEVRFSTVVSLLDSSSPEILRQGKAELQ